MRERGKSTRHNMMLMLVALLLVVSLIGGTMAWLTISDSLSNKFTVKVGMVENPKVPVDPDDPSKGETDETVDGNIYEPLFDDLTAENKELSLGKKITKDPYIGIGKGSETSYIFAWWDDNTKYTDKDGKEVEGAFDIKANTTGNASGKWVLVSGTSDNANIDGKSGLYVWSDTNGDPMKVTAEDASAWTAVLFADKEITVKSEGVQSLVDNGDNNTVDVYCFIHQALDGNGDPIEYNSVVLTAAKEMYESNNATN